MAKEEVGKKEKRNKMLGVQIALTWILPYNKGWHLWGAEWVQGAKPFWGGGRCEGCSDIAVLFAFALCRKSDEIKRELFRTSEPL